MRLELQLPDERATQRLGAALGDRLFRGDVLLLEGDLGAGKTTLVRAIARAVGVPEEVAVTSPTFALVHELPGPQRLLHADLYRLSSPEELRELDLLEAIGRGDAIVCIEWGEQFVRDLGAPTLRIRLHLEVGDARRVVLDAESERGRELLAAISARLAIGS